ncbi:MAG: OsmC family protein [Phycisphaerae bacterium]
MVTFGTKLNWDGQKQGNLIARDNPTLRVAAPPEFNGPDRTWCPEELFVAAIESCLMSTFLYFVERFGLSLSSYASESKGVLEKTREGLRFSAVEVNVEVAWEDDESLRKAESLRMKEKLEKYCPVSASLNCPVVLELEMRLT